MNAPLTVRQMVDKAIHALGGSTTNAEVVEWVLSEYPGTKKNTIQCQLVAGTVNHPSRVHYSVDVRPRLADNPLFDLFYRPATGKVETYVPDKHGQWEIYKLPDGRFSVRPGGETENVDEDSDAGHAFAAETHLRDYLAVHLEDIEPGLQLYVDDESVAGVEYRTEVGRIDLLAIDGDENFVVIELKVSKGPDSVAGQILRYKNWVKRKLAKDKKVRGIIIAQQVTDKVKYAIADDPEVTAKEYELSVVVKDVAKL